MQGDEAGQLGQLVNNYPDPTYQPLVGLEENLRGITLWAGIGGGYQNRVGKVKYDFWRASNIRGTVFNGSAGGSSNPNGLAVRGSLNVLVTPSDAPSHDMVMNTYHGELVPRDMIAVNYRMGEISYGNESGTNGEGLLAATGVFGMWSEYLRAGTYWIRNATGMIFINSDFGYRTPPQHLELQAEYLTGRPFRPDKAWDLTSFTRDDWGYLGEPGYDWIFDIPFLTFQAANLKKALPLDKPNGMLTSTRHFGAQAWSWDGKEPSSNPSLCLAGGWPRLPGTASIRSSPSSRCRAS
jgi:hypothetical protein